MAKRILLAVMCTLLALVIVMGCIVFDKVNTLLSVAQPPQSNPGVSSEPTEPPVSSEPPVTDPPVTEPPHEHNFVRIESIPATCTAFGYNVYACECGKTHLPSDEFTDPLGHNYQPGETVERTCTEDGYTPYTCTNCNDTEKRDISEAEGHILGVNKVTPPTCEEEGYTSATCSICKEDIISDVEQPLGHDYGQWQTITEAGDATPGRQERTCGNCEGVEVLITAPTGTLEIKDQAETLQTDSNEQQFMHYVIIVGTENTPEAYTYVVDCYLDIQLVFAYDENGLSVYEDGALEQILLQLDPYQNGQGALQVDTPENTESN